MGARFFRRASFLFFVGAFFNVAQAGALFADRPAAVAGQYVVKLRSHRVGIQSLGAFSLQERIGSSSNLVLVRSSAVGVQSLRSDRELQKLRAHPDVLFAEPNYLYYADQSLPAQLPNDADFSLLWGFNNIAQEVNKIVGRRGADIKAAQAWALSTGSPNVVVGIVDTGIDYNHPDLRANIWSSPENPAVHGINAITGELDPMDDNKHGTHVAGTIGASGNNVIGVSGVNWTIKMMGCKFLSAEGAGALTDAIKAIDWCVDHGAQILNNSWGGGPFSQALADSIQRAADRGVLFVASAGNNSSNNDLSPSYPASYVLPNVVAVAATNNQDLLASFSNYGAQSVHLSAPGDEIYSTLPGGAYGYLSGTSMATPQVTGAAALLLSREPERSYAELRSRLLASTDKIKVLRTRSVSGGRLNLYNLLANINPPGFNDIPASAWFDAPLEISTEHPYPTRFKKRWTVEAPGATYLKVHVKKLQTEKTFDKLKVINGDTGEVIEILSGKREGDFWTSAIDGSRMILEFISDTSINDYGFDIDAYRWTEAKF